MFFLPISNFLIRNRNMQLKAYRLKNIFKKKGVMHLVRRLAAVEQSSVVT